MLSILFYHICLSLSLTASLSLSHSLSLSLILSFTVSVPAGRSGNESIEQLLDYCKDEKETQFTKYSEYKVNRLANNMWEGMYGIFGTGIELNNERQLVGELEAFL